MFSTVGWVEAEVIERRSLGLSNTILGPALLVEEHTATVVEPGWKGALDSHGALLLEKV
jgi:N-methylhydantoinase A/oxoprolinase/acetone carboxylase beta subunit